MADSTQQQQPRRKPYAAIRQSNLFGLSDRELEAVIALVREGSDKKVALALGVVPISASGLLTQAQRRMGVSSRVQVALLWERRQRGGPAPVTGGQGGKHA